MKYRQTTLCKYLNIEGPEFNERVRVRVYCKRCGRPLSNPKSIERGYGPSCWKKRGGCS